MPAAGLHPDRLRSVVSVGLAMAVVGLNTTAIGVATRGIAAELDVTPATHSLIVGSYLVVAAAFSLVGGRLGDLAGHTRTFLTGVSVFAVGAFVAAIAPGTAVLILGRSIEGLGAALVLPASIELLAAHPPPAGQKAGFRIRGIVYSSAFGIGPLIGGVLTDHVSWRAIFWLELVLLVTAGAIAVPLLRTRSDLPRRPTRDLAGAGLSAVLVTVALGALFLVPEWGWWSWPFVTALVVALVLAVVLVAVERHTEHPLLHGKVLTDRVVIGANVATLAASIGMIGLLYFFNLFAQSAATFDSTAVAVAAALVPFTLSVVLFSWIAGRLSRRFAYRGPALVGLGLATIGFLWLSTTDATTSELDLLVPLVLCGVGAGIANAGLTTPAVLELPRIRLDEAAGLYSLTRYVGSAVAIAIGTSTYLSVTAQVPLPAGLATTASSEALAMGRTTFQSVVATLGEDLRGPFEAAARAHTADAFATTMLVAGLTLAVLTVISVVLLRPARRERPPTT